MALKQIKFGVSPTPSPRRWLFSGNSNIAPPPITPTTFDPATVAAVTLSGGDLVVTNTGTTSWNQGVRVADTHAQSTGKYYFEYTINNLAATGVNVDTTWGVALTSASYSGLPNAVNAFLMNQAGLVFSNHASYGTPFGQRASGNIIGIAINFDNQKIWFRIAPSGDWNNTPGGDPVTNAFGHTTAGLIGAMVPIVGFGGYVGVAGNVITANFGATAFSGAVPSGFTSGWPQ